MFDVFDLFISSHPHILILLGSCALACILASSHPYILMFVCTCLYPRIFTSSCAQVHVPSLASLHLISSGSCVLACNLYPHILLPLGLCALCACWYPRILTSSYLQVHVIQVLVGILASSHPHILRFQGSHLFRKLESDKTTVLTKNPAFMETDNGFNNFLTKLYILNKNCLYHVTSQQLQLLF